MPIDGAVQAAEHACFDVLFYLGEYYIFTDEEDKRLKILSGDTTSTATNAVAELVRKIGKDRATPAVVGQQMKILGLLDDPELSEREALVVSTFINVLCGIDAYDKVIADRQAEAARERPEPRPIPIDETTMETTDDHLATWEHG